MIVHRGSGTTGVKLAFRSAKKNSGEPSAMAPPLTIESSNWYVPGSRTVETVGQLKSPHGTTRITLPFESNNSTLFVEDASSSGLTLMSWIFDSAVRLKLTAMLSFSEAEAAGERLQL